MRYLIIGLGIYGTNLAKDLTDLGHEVIGADIRASNVDAVKDYISTAYILDSTDETSLSALPLKTVDLTVVTIGENFGASVKTVALLRKLGVRRLYARAIDDLHKAILEGLKVDRILTPEQRAAHDLVNEMELGSQVAILRVDHNVYVARFRAPKYFMAMKYSDLASEGLFGLRLVAAARPVAGKNVLGIDSSRLKMLDPEMYESFRVEEGDVFTCVGSSKEYKNLFRHLN